MLSIIGELVLICVKNAGKKDTIKKNAPLTCKSHIYANAKVKNAYPHTPTTLNTTKKGCISVGAAKEKATTAVRAAQNHKKEAKEERHVETALLPQAGKAAEQVAEAEKGLEAANATKEKE